MLRMTLTEFRERIAPLVQWPVTMRRANWLDADTLEWSVQYPGLLDAGERAYRHLSREHAPTLD
jgi:hypothetical protein